MSATTVIDLFPVVQHKATISAANGVGASPASGVIIGQIVDLLHGNNFCNVYVHGGPSSGPFRVQVQVSDGITSGSFGDPTSGQPSFLGPVLSGAIVWINSGLHASGNDNDEGNGPSIDNAPIFCSGGIQGFGFLRTGRYARLNVLSGSAFSAPVHAGFITQGKTIGSGTGFTLSPTSGVPSV